MTNTTKKNVRYPHFMLSLKNVLRQMQTRKVKVMAVSASVYYANVGKMSC